MIDARANWTSEAPRGPHLGVAELLPPSSRQELIPTLPGIVPQRSAALYAEPYSSRPPAETHAHSGPVSQARPTLSPQGTPDEQRTEWCVDFGTVLTTMDTFELWAAIDRGDVSASMRVWREGMECWTPVGQVSELALALSSASSQTPEPVTLHAVPSAPSFPALPSVPPAAPPPANEVRPQLSTLISGPRTSGWERLSQRILPPPTRNRARTHFWVALGSAVSATAITAAVISAEPPVTSSPVESAAALTPSAPALGAAAPPSAPALAPIVAPPAPAVTALSVEPGPPAALAVPASVVVSGEAPDVSSTAAPAAPRAGLLRAAPPRPRHEERGQHRLRRSGKSPYGW